MTRPPGPADDDARDAWLRAALRHAPDRDVQPSPAVSERIRRSARAAAAGGARPSRAWWRVLGEALGRLARPAPAAALASVMLATVIGVMWRDGPPPDEPARIESAVRSTAPAASVPQAARPEAPAAPASVEAAPASVAQERARDREAAGRGVAQAGRGAARHEAPARKQAAAAPSSDTARADAAAAAAKAAPDEAPKPAEPVRAAPPRREEAAAPPPAPAAAAAPSARNDAPAAAPVDERRLALSRAAPAEERAQAARLRAPASEGAGYANADPLAEPAAGWIAATPAQRAALDELRRLTAGRWRPAPADAAGPATAVLTDAQGLVVGRLRVADGAVLWLPEQPAGFAWHATLRPDEAEALAERLRPPVRALPAAR